MRPTILEVRAKARDSFNRAINGTNFLGQSQERWSTSALGAYKVTKFDAGEVAIIRSKSNAVLAFYDPRKRTVQLFARDTEERLLLNGLQIQLNGADWCFTVETVEYSSHLRFSRLSRGDATGRRVRTLNKYHQTEATFSI